VSLASSARHMSQLKSMAIGAAVAGVAFAIYRYTCKAKAPKSLTLTYFDIAAAPGEKVRLALKLAGVPFTDNRIKFPDWGALKPKTKYGQMPFVEADGEELYQSGALLRWAGQLGSGSLYPVDDPVACRKIEEMIGVAEDLVRAWSPALYMGMGRHANYGHPADWAGKDACVKAMREKFVAEELPKYAKFISEALEANGSGFICGPKPTIADCNFVPQLLYFTKGVADHVPKDCLDKYPQVMAYLARFKALLPQHYS